MHASRLIGRMNRVSIYSPTNAIKALPLIRSKLVGTETANGHFKSTRLVGTFTLASGLARYRGFALVSGRAYLRYWRAEWHKLMKNRLKRLLPKS